MPGEHAKYAPSASKRWINCPGSISLAPPTDPDAVETPSVYAHEGTVCHNISADCLRERKSPSEYLGHNVEGVEITQELVDAITFYVDEIISIASEMKVTGGKIEFKVKITPDCWGTVDASMWNTEILSINDAKFGKEVIVEAEENTQMMIYGIGTLKMLKEEGIPMPKKVVMTIIQPRTVNPVRTYTLTIQELQDWAKGTLAPALARLRDGDETCVPSGKTCMWCPIGFKCTARAGKMLEKAAEAFAPFTGEEPPEIETATGGDSSPLLGLDKMATLALSFKAIKDWMKDIRAELVTHALAGEEVPFFKLVAGRSVRKWGADEDTLVTFLEDHGVDAYDKKLKTPPAVEKEMGKKKAKEVDLYELITKPEGKPTLVPETDKRPALEMNVSKQFEEFVEEVAEKTPPKEESASGLSLMQRLSQGGDKDKTKAATSGTVDVTNREEDFVRYEPGDNPSPPNAPKRKLVLETLLEGDSTLDALAEICSATPNGIKMHLRYLHERDEYGYTLYKDGRVEIHK